MRYSCNFLTGASTRVPVHMSTQQFRHSRFYIAKKLISYLARSFFFFFFFFLTTTEQHNARYVPEHRICLTMRDFDVRSLDNDIFGLFFLCLYMWFIFLFFSFFLSFVLSFFLFSFLFFSFLYCFVRISFTVILFLSFAFSFLAIIFVNFLVS